MHDLREPVFYHHTRPSNSGPSVPEALSPRRPDSAAQSVPQAVSPGPLFVYGCRRQRMGALGPVPFRRGRMLARTSGFSRGLPPSNGCRSDRAQACVHDGVLESNCRSGFGSCLHERSRRALNERGVGRLRVGLGARLGGLIFVCVAAVIT